jgi:NADH-quinone oxidoreductase subunit F
MNKIKNRHDLDKRRQLALDRRAAQQKSLAVCCGTGCRASGALDVVEALRREAKKAGLEPELNTRMTGCHGFCEQGPLVLQNPGNILYCRVTPADATALLEESILGGRLVERLFYTDPGGHRTAAQEDIPFYRKQVRLILAQNGRLDPTDVDDYLAQDGYAALVQVLGGMTPDGVVTEITASGLRGRGGGGFPTGLKWQYCRRAAGEPKYLICNADEGDPGAFQDRSILEGNPHLVVEGMIIGAYAAGARYGYIYVRNEYPLALKHLEAALAAAYDLSLLGEDILGSGFAFDLKVVRGGGAFVCGEETALISSVEGLAGEPRPRPPYPAVSGLWGKPTLINNVKTWAVVPLIIKNGAAWHAGVGTAESKGSMIFSLTGKVNNTGLVEVPLGLTLRELVHDIGGGIPGHKKFKAVQTGGPSGGCLPERLLDLPLDYEALLSAGAMMGSGGVIVMDESTCMVDVARYFLSFTQDESCGKCVPCREGGRQLLALLNNICAGQSRPEDLDLLSELAAVMQEGSLCALGRLAPNPVLTTLKYFRQEYEAHILEQSCPAGVCRALITYLVDAGACTGCGKCTKNCPVQAVSGEKKQPHSIDTALCTRCGACLEACSFGAIKAE